MLAVKKERVIRELKYIVVFEWSTIFEEKEEGLREE